MSEGSSDKPGPRRLAETMHTIGTAGSGIRLAKTIGFSALLLFFSVFFLIIGIPWYLCVGIVFLAVAVSALQAVSFKRIASIDISKLNDPIPDSVPLDSDEVLVETIPAVMEIGKIRSVSFLGAGKVIRPENALLFTNQAVWALTVPISGADKVVSDADIGEYEWMFQYEDIAAMLLEMQAGFTLEELLRQCRAKKLMNLSDIYDVRTPSMTYAVTFADRAGHRFGYSIRRKEDYERAKNLLRQM